MPPLVLAFLQAPSATTQRYHQTLPLMGSDASRVGIFSAASSRVIGKRCCNYFNTQDSSHLVRRCMMSQRNMEYLKV